jgi:capsular polysaccharide biosynthesis protein
LSERAAWGIRVAWPHSRIVRVMVFVRFVRWRVWMLAPPLILAVLGALLSTYLQKPSYQATAEVLANRADGTVLPFLIQPPRRVGDVMRAEALAARSPELAARVVAVAGVPGMSTEKLLAASTVTPAFNSDLLRFSVSDSHSRYAMLLANTYAREFVFWKTETDSTGVKGALRLVNTKIEALRAKGATTSPSYSTLLQHRLQLEAVGRLLRQQVSVLQLAANASTVRKHPTRSALLDGILGALLGVGLVAIATLWRSRKPR